MTADDDRFGTWARCPYCGDEYCVEEDPCLSKALARVAELTAYLLADAYCPCCGDSGPGHRDGCDYNDERMERAREVLAEKE